MTLAHLLHPFQSAHQPSCPDTVWMCLPLSLLPQFPTNLRKSLRSLVVRRLRRIDLSFEDVLFTRNAVCEEELGLDVRSWTVDAQQIDIVASTWTNGCRADGSTAFNSDGIENLCYLAICVLSDLLPDR